MQFATARMVIQCWNETLDDDDQRRALVDDLKGVLTPAVLQHLPKSLQISDGQTAMDDWIAERALESDVNLVRDCTNDRVLGLLILAEFTESEVSTRVHLGYLFSENAWGKGYATELISGLVTWYKNEGQSVQLLGGVETDNVASARALQKNGFELVEELSNTTTQIFGLQIPKTPDRLYGTRPRRLGN